jgi:hypothetical protein
MCKTTGADEPHGANSIVGKFLLVNLHSLLRKANAEGGVGNVIVSLL